MRFAVIATNIVLLVCLFFAFVLILWNEQNVRELWFAAIIFVPACNIHLVNKRSGWNGSLVAANFLLLIFLLLAVHVAKSISSISVVASIIVATPCILTPIYLYMEREKLKRLATNDPLNYSPPRGFTYFELKFLALAPPMLALVLALCIEEKISRHPPQGTEFIITLAVFFVISLISIFYWTNKK